MENEMTDKTIAMFSSLFCELGCLSLNLSLNTNSDDVF